MMISKIMDFSHKHPLIERIITIQASFCGSNTGVFRYQLYHRDPKKRPAIRDGVVEWIDDAHYGFLNNTVTVIEKIPEMLKTIFTQEMPFINWDFTIDNTPTNSYDYSSIENGKIFVTCDYLPEFVIKRLPETYQSDNFLDITYSAYYGHICFNLTKKGDCEILINTFIPNPHSLIKIENILDNTNLSLETIVYSELKKHVEDNIVGNRDYMNLLVKAMPFISYYQSQYKDSVTSIIVLRIGTSFHKNSVVFKTSISPNITQYFMWQV